MLARDGRGYPRVSGDRPYAGVTVSTHPKVPPRQRGSALLAFADQAVFSGTPAPAGIGPTSSTCLIRAARYPRASGDRPLTTGVKALVGVVPPRQRGSAAIRNDPGVLALGTPAPAGIGRRCPICTKS